MDIVIITLQQEAENIKEEENARSIQICEESFIIDDGELMGCNIADDIRYANDNQQECID